jgi:hypothetical protein
MTRLVTRLMVAAMVVLTGAMLNAQAHTAHSLTGRWMLKMADGPHGPSEMPLTLTQDGTKVTAILSPPGHGADFELKGEFVKGQLTLAIAASDKNIAVTIKATLKDDGTLVGFTSSEMGDSKWVGSRVKS